MVIPAFNEALLLARCIDSVLAAGIPPADVYVVDDQSTDGTAGVAGGYEGVNVLVNPARCGKLGALQNAIAHFALAERYAFLSLLDADSRVAPEYFGAVIERFSSDPGTVLVCGAPQSERCNWLTAYRAFEYAVTLHAYRAGQARLGVITVAPGCASTYATRILDQVDWAGGTLVEDMDLTVQIHRKRLGRIAFAPGAVAYTQDPRTVREYVGQMTRWYSGTWQVFRLHGIPFGWQRIDAEFALLLAEGLLYSLAFFCLPLLAIVWPSAVLRCFLFDQALSLALASACAVALRRIDLVVCFPAFALVRAMNCVLLVWTCVQEVVRGRKRTAWFSVGRY